MHRLGFVQDELAAIKRISDIDLLNQNTHDTFLSLAFTIRNNIYDPHDAILEVEHLHPEMYKGFKRRLNGDMRKTIQEHGDKIGKIIALVMRLLEQTNSWKKRP